MKGILIIYSKLDIQYQFCVNILFESKRSTCSLFFLYFPELGHQLFDPSVKGPLAQSKI